MIFLFVISAISKLLTFAFSLLPAGATFLNLPDAIYDAFGTASGWVGWISGLFGSTVKTAVLSVLGLMLTIGMAVFIIEVLKHFKPPVLNRFDRS